MKLFVSSDCALGSRRGDVDDGFAVAALLASPIPLAALASSHGNASESEARENLSRLVERAGRGRRSISPGSISPLSITRGAARPGSGEPSPAARWLAAEPGRLTVLALGPLTDVAAALRLDPSGASRWEVWLVGGNRRSRGRWPPLWPHEFNLTRDREATATVLGRVEDLTFVPLDVARRLRFAAADLQGLAGDVGELLRAGSWRWLRRSLWLKGRKNFPVWDLVAALAIVRPDLFVRHRAPLSSGVPLAAYGLTASQDREVSWLAGYDAAGVGSVFQASILGALR